MIVKSLKNIEVTLESLDGVDVTVWRHLEGTKYPVLMERSEKPQRGDHILIEERRKWIFGKIQRIFVFHDCLKLILESAENAFLLHNPFKHTFDSWGDFIIFGGRLQPLVRNDSNAQWVCDPECEVVDSRDSSLLELTWRQYVQERTQRNNIPTVSVLEDPKKVFQKLRKKRHPNNMSPILFTYKSKTLCHDPNENKIWITLDVSAVEHSEVLLDYLGTSALLDVLEKSYIMMGCNLDSVQKIMKTHKKQLCS